MARLVNTRFRGILRVLLSADIPLIRRCYLAVVSAVSPLISSPKITIKPTIVSI
jgi:hypothetical protein